MPAKKPLDLLKWNNNHLYECLQLKVPRKADMKHLVLNLCDSLHSSAYAPLPIRKGYSDLWLRARTVSESRRLRRVNLTRD